MHRRHVLTGIGAIVAGGLTGCLQETEESSRSGQKAPQSTRAGPQQAVEDYVSAVNTDDVQGVKASMHSESPRRNMTSTLMLVDRLEITVHELETVSTNDTHATVRANVTVSGMGQKERTDRQLALRTEDGEWKLW